MLQTFSHGPMTWKVTAKTHVWSDIASWRTKVMLSNCVLKVATPCINDHQFKEEEMGSVGELSKVCSQIVPNMLARVDTKLVDLRAFFAPDAQLVWFHSLITQMITDIIVMWETRLSTFRLSLFQDSDFAGDFEDSKSTSGGIFCIFGRSNICSHKLDVQEGKRQCLMSSTESESHFFGCWFANGRTPCGCFMGCGERSVTFLE